MTSSSTQDPARARLHLPSYAASPRPVSPATRWTPLGLAVAMVLVAVGSAGARSGVPVAAIAAALAVAVWNVALVLRSSVGTRPLSIAVDVRAQHYLQACAQGTVLAYWGWYWPPVYDALPLIAIQLIFGYAFDMLLGWTRRGEYTLGFGPFPVVFSINLFLWFVPEWFACQLLLVAVGFAAKDLLRWTRDGRRVHIFNPSSFPLAVASLVLIAAGASDLTRGQDIAVSQFYPPQMYLLIFLVGLPGQLLFGVASMTLAAVLTTCVAGVIFHAWTGTYFFLDSYVPIAVFLGMHLLFTDPSTSPRTELGRLLFGALYGLTAVGLYRLLTDAGIPAFYDKLLQVPVLNLSVRAIDGAVRSSWLARLDPGRWWIRVPAARRHVAYAGAWVLTFAVLSATGGVGDDHPGQWLPFWQDACRSRRPGACAYAGQLESILCDAGSGWACNAAGRRRVQQALETGATPDARRAAVRDATADFARGCRLGFIAACENRVHAADGEATLADGPPAIEDYPVLVRGSKGPVRERRPSALYARACAQGWTEACGKAHLPGVAF